MKKSEAQKRIEDLRTSFELLFAQNVLEERTVRAEWLDNAVRLAADIFGNDDQLYKRIISAQELSKVYEIEPEGKKKLILAKEWHSYVADWLDRMSANIAHGTGFDKTEIQNTKWFVIAYPLVLIAVAALLNYFHSQSMSNAEQKFILEQIENKNRIELSSVMAEFEYWSKGVQVGLPDSLAAIRWDFSNRGVYYSGGHIDAVHKWALRKRFSIDSARSSYFARISSLGGDTTKLKAPRRLGIRIDQALKNLADQLDIDISRLRLDTI